MGRSEKKKRQDARVKAAIQAALAQIDAKKAAAASPPAVVPKTGKIVQQQPSPVQQPLPPIKGVSKAVLAKVSKFKIVQIQNQQMAAANVVPKTKRVDASPLAPAPAPKMALQQQQAQIAAAAAAAAAAAVAAVNQTPPAPPPQLVKKIAAADDEGMDSAQEVETGGEADDRQKASGKQAATA